MPRHSPTNRTVAMDSRASSAILAWIVFLVLFVVYTALNIRWHAEALSHG